MTINEIEDELKKRTDLELLAVKLFIDKELNRRDKERDKNRKGNKT